MDLPKLTEIPLFCIQEICSYLSIGDLLNAADTCTLLQRAALYVYAHKYGRNTSVSLRIIDYMYGDIAEEKHENGNRTIQAFSWQRSFQIVRLFGHLITKMEIDIVITYTELTVRYTTCSRKLFPYIAQRGANSLIEIEFQRLPERVLNYYTAPFTSVQCLTIAADSDGNLLSQLFPNLRKLIFKTTFCRRNDMHIAFHFPHLEHFVLDSAWDFREAERLTLEGNQAEINSFLRLNPQLQSFKLPVFISPN